MTDKDASKTILSALIGPSFPLRSPTGVDDDSWHESPLISRATVFEVDRPWAKQNTHPGFLASTVLAAGVILNALHQRANFYSACVYLSQSTANLMILTNFCLLIVGFLLYGLQKLLYGPLRPIETEQLYERGWFAVTETCLAMTIFRGEIGAWFLVMFVCLFVGKVWGWIGEGRVEILDQQPPQRPRLFHTRLALSLILAVTFNTLMLEYAVKTVLRNARPDMMVMFGFEFAILSILSTSTAARYGISLWELYVTRQQRHAKMEERRAEIRAARAEAIRQQSSAGPQELLNTLPSEDDIDEMELDVPGWEEKGRWIFYLDLATDFLKLVVYLSFFAILFTFYGLPIHILRDVVLTMRSFGKRVVDFLRYRNATRDMHQRYPDATAEDIATGDAGGNPDNLPAGPQQFGFGFGFERPPPVQQPAPVQQIPQPTVPNAQINLHHTQAQLQQVEQHISQVIESLRTTAEQLQVVRLLQAELTRLRAAQANVAHPHTQPPHQPHPHPHPQPQPQPQVPAPAVTPTGIASSHVSSTGTQRQFTSNPQIPALGSGDSRLPEGLSLPQDLAFPFSSPSHGSHAEPEQTSSTRGHTSASSSSAPPDWGSTISNETIYKPVAAAPGDDTSPATEEEGDNIDERREVSDQSLSKGKSRAATVEDYIEDSA
ncbi:predicted protein [Histoplasma mississippiense (nom. inval.)]|uniref:predicted protein n=1 Tax=Ajellomyces capsulatus (strain NAm1 / WU24) TaxID=2059318 RepID=UPI000157BD74|nr:predicted protein [Histoplasma mississippiense (nom. inval.)]EDN06167.1 predicted protein [Histoplasma mississippiense (nom. inval.)]